MIHIQSLIGGRAENQDFYGTIQTQFGELIIVCDGMGGHNGGRHAAEVAVHTILDVVFKSELADPVTALQTAIKKANASIWNESQRDRNLKGMGTTVVALLITPEKAICFHVGDSRIYQLRNGEILFRTFDHSHVFEMVKVGILTEEQARLSDKSNIITRALGIKSTVEIDCTDNLSYQKGDRFLLCTDGICGAVPESELLEMMNQNGSVESVVAKMVETIDSIGKVKGGKHDNLSAALTEMETDGLFQQVDNKNDELISRVQDPPSKKTVFVRVSEWVFAKLIKN